MALHHLPKASIHSPHILCNSWDMLLHDPLISTLNHLSELYSRACARFVTNIHIFRMPRCLMLGILLFSTATVCHIPLAGRCMNVCMNVISLICRCPLPLIRMHVVTKWPNSAELDGQTHVIPTRCKHKLFVGKPAFM